MRMTLPAMASASRSSLSPGSLTASFVWIVGAAAALLGAKKSPPPALLKKGAWEGCAAVGEAAGDLVALVVMGSPRSRPDVVQRIRFRLLPHGCYLFHLFEQEDHRGNLLKNH